MLNCKMGWHQILGLLCFLFSLHSSLPFASPLCPPDQRDALLRFKNSFVLDVVASDYCQLHYPSYPKINSWNKGVDCCSWGGVTCDNVTGNVIGLDLTCSWFRAALYSNSSLLLPKLEVLLLRSCNLTKFPYFLNSLRGLTYLDLSSNRISGEIPEWFWEISHDTLEKLEISHNLMRGGIQQLHWKRLSYINLENNFFQGPLPIPPPSTSSFYASNNGFTGEIPSSICQLSSLKYLDLSNNNLSGNMPPCFGNISNLVVLDLSSNKLQGSLPRSLVKCVKLFSLGLSHNEFSDIFPRWLEAPKLSSLDLRSNKFHDRINLTAFGPSFPTLAYLYLSNNNFLGWWLTEDFSNTSLIVIDLSNNMFGGPIPLPSPITVFYSIANNNFAGKIPSLTCNATKLEMINLSNNSLTSSLPRCITNFSTHLSVLELRRNHLEGTIPQSFSWRNSLTILDLSQNWFKGKLPRSLDKCENLEVLSLSDNRIEDTFPGWLGTLPQLEILTLRSNNFKGSLDIPSRDDLFPKLHILDLSNNNFAGPLPANLIKNLYILDLSNNNFAGPLPANLIKNLYILDLSNNNFAGPLPANLIKNLYILDLSNNNFAGPLPANLIKNLKVMMNGHNGRETSLDLVQSFEKISYYNYISGILDKRQLLLTGTIITVIDLSNNSFKGDIPGDIGHLKSLTGLNLSHNHFTGSIPLTLGNLSILEWLDVSSNKLCGGIPGALVNLLFLGYLNLSNNRLIGRIPEGNQFTTFGSDSFSGNPGLCGVPLPKECSPGTSLSTFNCKGHRNWFKQKTVWIGYSSGIVIGISIAYIAVGIGRPKWLAQGVRMLERRAAEWMEKPKRKATNFHGK